MESKHETTRQWMHRFVEVFWPSVVECPNCQPIRGQDSVHVIWLDQSEVSIEAYWPMTSGLRMTGMWQTNSDDDTGLHWSPVTGHCTAHTSSHLSLCHHHCLMSGAWPHHTHLKLNGDFTRISKLIPQFRYPIVCIHCTIPGLMIHSLILYVPALLCYGCRIITGIELLGPASAQGLFRDKIIYMTRLTREGIWLVEFLASNYRKPSLDQNRKYSFSHLKWQRANRPSHHQPVNHYQTHTFLSTQCWI